jgi:hypothetical protein
MIPLSRIMRICLVESAAFLAGRARPKKKKAGRSPPSILIKSLLAY